MWKESAEEIKPLRSGLTTGSCATACCVAAARALFANHYPDSVEISLPRGKHVELPIKGYRALHCHVGGSELERTHSNREDPAAQSSHNYSRPLNLEGMRVETIKDAGDDPDATHGATIFVEVRLLPRVADNASEPNVVFKAAAGVGTVTKVGLLLPVGEPAINPVPRSMMTSHLQKTAQVYNYNGDFEVSVGVVDGESIAEKTMNGRLGILGGLSILGTTGIVRPFSCAAYIASIRQGVDVASSNGITHIAASTGSSSEAAISDYYQMDPMALIEMGDFVGALLKHLKKGQVQTLSICGGFGKMTKLAQGALDLNSRKCSIDFGFLAQCVEQLLKGSEDRQPLLENVKNANTSIEVLNICQSLNLPIADLICRLAQQQAKKIVAPSIAVEVFAINRRGEIIASVD